MYGGRKDERYENAAGTNRQFDKKRIEVMELLVLPELATIGGSFKIKTGAN